MTDSPDRGKKSYRAGVALRWGIPVGISIALLVYLLHTVQHENLLAAFSRLRLKDYLLLTVLHLLLIYLVSPLTWMYILRFFDCRPKARHLFQVWIGAIGLKVVLPKNLEAVLPVAYLARGAGLSPSRGVGSMLLFHFIKFFSLGFLFTLGVGLSYGFAHPFSLACYTALLAIILGMPHASFFVRPARKIHPRLGEIVANLTSGFRALPLGSRLILVTVFSVLQSLDVFAIGLALRGCGIAVPIASLFLLAPWVFTASFLPVSYLGFGVREVSMIYLFGAFDSTHALFSAGLGLSFCLEAVPVMLSLIFLPGALALSLTSKQQAPPSDI